VNTAAFPSLLREAFVSATSRVVPTLLSLTIIAGSVMVVFLTTGRAAASEQTVLSALDAAGTRTIVVEAPVSAGMYSTILARLKPIEGISWTGAFSPAVDVRNAFIPQGDTIAVRETWASDFTPLGIADGVARSRAWATDDAMDALGLGDRLGPVSGENTPNLDISGGWQQPDFLGFLGPTVIVPQENSRAGAVSVIVAIAEQPGQVATIASAIVAALGIDDPSKAKVSTSEELANIRVAIQGSLENSGRETAAIVFGAMSVLVAAMLFSLVLMRRKDFGRRRALGASRQYLYLLLSLQTALIASSGVLLGTGVSLVIHHLTGEPAPGSQFIAAVGILTIVIASVAALPAATVAAFREPVRELRVP
jgi:putative ABC transport system permease protein